MLSNRHHIQELLIRYINGDASPAEIAEITQWAALSPKRKAILQMLGNPEALLNMVVSTSGTTKKEEGWKAWTMAACVILLLGVGLYFLPRTYRHQPDAIKGTIAAHAPTIGPGHNTAVLTMADGGTICLDSIRNGLWTTANVTINKADSIIEYPAVASSGLQHGRSNILTTPAGGKFQVGLPDGSHVWLNNVSSLRFPTSFAGESQRVVTLTGEAFFDIAKNAKQPFIVRVRNLSFKVLGTSFNISAYADDPTIKTTLVRGKLEVQELGQSIMLMPGQQWTSVGEGQPGVVNAGDTASAEAWRNGLFYFKKQDLQSILAQLERWYHVKVKYTGKVPEIYFEGTFDRTDSLKTVVNYINKSDSSVQITLVDSTLIIAN